MPRMIRVRRETADGWQVTEADVEEAQRILEATYADDSGGLVVDGKTQQVIWLIGPDVEEIVIMPELLIAGG